MTQFDVTDEAMKHMHVLKYAMYGLRVCKPLLIKANLDDNVYNLLKITVVRDFH